MVELGVSISIEERLGTYDHIYETAEVVNSGGKHYVAHGLLVIPDSESFFLDAQHRELSVFDVCSLLDLHPHVEAYFRHASIHPDSRIEVRTNKALR